MTHSHNYDGVCRKGRQAPGAKKRTYKRLYVGSYLLSNLYVCLYVLPNLYVRSYVRLSVLSISYVCLHVLPNLHVWLSVLLNLYVRFYLHFFCTHEGQEKSRNKSISTTLPYTADTIFPGFRQAPGSLRGGATHPLHSTGKQLHQV